MLPVILLEAKLVEHAFPAHPDAERELRNITERVGTRLLVISPEALDVERGQAVVTVGFGNKFLSHLLVFGQKGQVGHGGSGLVDYWIGGLLDHWIDESLDQLPHSASRPMVALHLNPDSIHKVAARGKAGGRCVVQPGVGAKGPVAISVRPGVHTRKTGKSTIDYPLFDLRPW
jgi:hypothetical protein